MKRYLRLALLVLWPVYLTTARADVGPTPPVPLYTPPLHTPLEAGGTGLAPEVAVRVTVDARGRVSAVEIESIEPESEYDELFENVARETLLRWRYAPATREGAPVETTLSWIVQFPAIRAQEEDDAPPWEWRSGSDESSADDRRRRILSLPRQQRLKFLDQQAQIVRGAMSPDAVAKFNSSRFMVFTDAPAEGIARTLASNLEATFDTLHTLVGQALETQPEPYRVVVFMFASEANYKRVGKLDWASGYYNPLGMLAFHMQMPSNESLLSIMLHEATHAYIDRYLSKPGVLFPRWLDEGFAEYVGNSTIKDGKLIPGKTRKTEVYRTPQMAVRGKTMARRSVGDVKKAMRSGEAITIEELISTEFQDFYGERRNLHYPMSWLLVHFLRHGEDGWADESFPRLMLYVAEGYPGREAFREIYGEPTELEQAFREYVRKF